MTYNVLSGSGVWDVKPLHYLMPRFSNYVAFKWLLNVTYKTLRDYFLHIVYRDVLTCKHPAGYGLVYRSIVIAKEAAESECWPCVAAAGLPKSRRCLSQATGSHAASFVAVTDGSLYSDSADSVSHHGISISADSGGRHGVSIMPSWCPHGVSSKPLTPCRSAGSGDASATSMRTIDDNSVYGGLYHLLIYFFI